MFFSGKTNANFKFVVNLDANEKNSYMILFNDIFDEVKKTTSY